VECGVLHLVSPVCDLALSPSPLLRDAQDFLRGALVDLTSSPLRVGNWHGMVVCVVAARTRVKHGLVHHGNLLIRITLSDSVT
jgi:hypothetical protein